MTEGLFQFYSNPDGTGDCRYRYKYTTSKMCFTAYITQLPDGLDTREVKYLDHRVETELLNLYVLERMEKLAGNTHCFPVRVSHIETRGGNTHVRFTHTCPSDAYDTIADLTMIVPDGEFNPRLLLNVDSTYIFAIRWIPEHN